MDILKTHDKKNNQQMTTKINYTFLDIFRGDEKHLLANVNSDGVGVTVAVEVAPYSRVHPRSCRIFKKHF
jgi:hypothetical protein